MKHTPGPWLAERDDKLNGLRAYGIVRDLGRDFAEQVGVEYATEVIAEVCAAANGTDEADARLIAAAPELLAACEDSLKYICASLVPNHPLRLKLQAAIAKAEGF